MPALSSPDPGGSLSQPELCEMKLKPLTSYGPSVCGRILNFRALSFLQVFLERFQEFRAGAFPRELRGVHWILLTQGQLTSSRWW